MSHNSSSMKLKLTTATLLALEVNGHGYFNSAYDPKTPMTRNFLFSTTVTADFGADAFIKGSENRVSAYDGSGCPNLWAGTSGGGGCTYPSSNNGCCGGWSDMTEFQEELTSGGTWNADRGWYEGGTFTGKYTSCFTGSGGNPNRQASNNIDNHRPQKVYTAGQVIDLSWIVTANHGGMVEYGVVCDGDETYANFRKYRVEQVSGGKVYNQGWTTHNGATGNPSYAGASVSLTSEQTEELIAAYDAAGIIDMANGRITKIPEGVLSETHPLAPYAGATIQNLNFDNPQRSVTAKHISALKEIRGSLTMSLYDGVPRGDGIDAILSNEEGEKSYWNWVPPKANSNYPDGTAFVDRIKLRADVFGDKCTLGWFWWGKVSPGTFVACADIKIVKPCEAGKILNADGDCVPGCTESGAGAFDVNCADCSSSKPAECGKCHENFKVENGFCTFDCSSLDANCSECALGLDDEYECTQCESGFIRDGNQCKPDCKALFGDQCEDCNAGTCLSCPTAGYVIDDQTGACRPGCGLEQSGSCNECSADNRTCVKCNEKYELTDGVCVSTGPCGQYGPECRSCGPGTTEWNRCWECTPPYVLTSDSSSCMLPGGDPTDPADPDPSDPGSDPTNPDPSVPTNPDAPIECGLTEYYQLVHGQYICRSCPGGTVSCQNQCVRSTHALCAGSPGGDPSEPPTPDSDEDPVARIS